VKDNPARGFSRRRRRIRFDNVVLRYDPERVVLKDLLPRARRQDSRGGRSSGAGKSTISRILYRFYDIAVEV